MTRVTEMTRTEICELALDIAHEYWDMCKGASEAEIAEHMAEHDRWAEIADRAMTGEVTEEEKAEMQEWADMWE